MSLRLTRPRKVEILVGCLAFALATLALSSLLREYISPSGPAACIYDNLRAPTMPLTAMLVVNPQANRLFIALDSLMIDVLVVVSLSMYLLKGAMGVAYVPPLFYIVRALGLQLGGQWPRPAPYLFADTRVPSLFVTYEPTNDLYFSGHIGLTTSLFVVSLHAGRRKMTVLAAVALLYTLAVLTLTGGHYTNDMIIGHAMALLTCSVGLRHMYEVTYLALECYCLAVDKVERTVRLRDKGPQTHEAVRV